MHPRGHICLVGTALCRNRQLIERLAGRHSLTLLPEVLPDDMQMIARADVVAVDCREGGVAATGALVDSLRRATNGVIVVMDGGLCRDDIARLLSAGARDYFSEPFNVAVIAERLEHLASPGGLRHSPS